MNYCKITQNNKAHKMPNPISISISNPTEEQKELIAQLNDWLPMEYTEKPEYDSGAQYVTDYWIEESGKAVQCWEINDKEDE